MNSEALLEQLIEETTILAIDKPFPNHIESVFTVSPEIVLKLLSYYINMNDNKRKQT